MKAIDIMNVLDRWAPSYLVDEWDNTGFQIGDPERQVEKIIVALDLDRQIFEQAVKEEAQMIITHHPIIFEPLKSITRMDSKEGLIYDIIRKDIVAYNAHTNLDLANGGVNDALAKVLAIGNTQPLKIIHEESHHGYGRIGEIDRVDLSTYLDNIKKALNVDNLIVYGDKDKMVSRIAVCGGSGSSFIYDAYLKKADLYITGDIKYHEAQYANELGLTLVDGGHYHTEKVILPVIKDYLEKELPNKVDVIVHDQSSPPYEIY